MQVHEYAHPKAPSYKMVNYRVGHGERLDYGKKWFTNADVIIVTSPGEEEWHEFDRDQREYLEYLQNAFRLGWELESTYDVANTHSV